MMLKDLNALRKFETKRGKLCWGIIPRVFALVHMHLEVLTAPLMSMMTLVTLKQFLEILNLLGFKKLYRILDHPLQVLA